MFNRNTSKLGSLALAGLLIASSFAMVMGTVGVAAAGNYEEDYSGNADVIVSNETQTTDDLNTIFADITAVSDINSDGTTTTSTSVDYEIYGINESATNNDTLLDSGSRSISQGTTESIEYMPNSTEKDEYNSFYVHVKMTTSGTSGYIESTDFGTLYTESGALGGGGLLDGAGSSTGALAVVALAGAALLMRRN